VLIADVYVRAAHRQMEEAEFDLVSQSLGQQLAALGRDHLPHGLSLRYQFEEGSVVGRLKVIGALLGTLYVGIANYPDFRNGIIQLYDDASAFGSAALELFKKETGVTAKDIQYKRISSGDVGKLYNVVRNIDLIRSDRTSPSHRTEAKDEISSNLRSLASSMPREEFSAILHAIPRHDVPELPGTAEEAITLFDDRKRIGTVRDGSSNLTQRSKRPAPKIRRKFRRTFSL